MIFFIYFLLTVKCDAAPGHYECGEHGRFEYCIDDNPGCVIGCHCFPGYYFDTESKICEPNTKLTQDYRRHMTLTGYNLGSSSGLVPPAPPTTLLENPASPNEPAQDSNDGTLSDWLYNQFFKTIESQVVNKTDDEPLTVGTRRSGAPIEPLLTRRHRKRKYRKHNLRKKKDDSSYSEEDSSSSSDSDSSDDDSKGLGSWERFEVGPRPRPGEPPDALPELKKDGSHRQIVMYSKKPKPPLPSFIFLPNMGTMFYPPIGLPAPPMPMYPMVPIPPIHPGQPGTPDCVESDTNTSTTTNTTLKTPVDDTPKKPDDGTPKKPDDGTPKKPDDGTPKKPDDGTPKKPDDGTPKKPDDGTPKKPDDGTPKKPDDGMPKKPDDGTPQKDNPLRNSNLRNKFHPKFRSTPQARQVFKPSPLPPPMDYPAKQYHKDSDYDAMFMGDSLFQDQGGPDFNYISDLIHRENNETTSKSPTISPKRYEQLFGMKPPMIHENKKRQPIMPGRLDSTRRRFDPRKNGEDDSYYSSLGKQIAKLIRGLDSTDVHRDDNKIPPAEDLKPTHPFFSESSYAARTYWERFVRSPLSLRLKNFTKYEDLIASNENLFDLENQVQEATTAPNLSLLELENVINTMGAIRNQVHDRRLKKNKDKLSDASLNVSLLPRFSGRTSIVKQKPEIITNDNMTFATFQNVIGRITTSDQRQKTAKKGFENKTEELPEHSKIARNNNLVHNPPRSIYLSTNILKPRSIISTLKPNTFISHLKGKKHAIKHANSKKLKVNHGVIDNFNEIDNTPHMIFRGGETTYIKSNKYFFDRNVNQYTSWAVDSVD